jgi:hypothetical protein
VPKTTIESWDPAKDFRFRTASADDFELMRGSVAWSQTLVKRLVDGGAQIIAGTDVGNPWLVPGYSLHDELALLVGAKLTPLQALQAATTNAAAFAQSSDFGSIEVGRRADLVLLDRNPLADIANTRSIVGVMLRGRWLAAAELAAELDKIAAIYAGTRSRFDGAPAAPSSATFGAVFTISAPFSSGEERLSVADSTLLAETRIDGEPDTRWELDLGASGLGDKLRIEHDGLDVTIVRNGTRAKVTGVLGADKVALDEPIAGDELLGGTPLGIELAWMRKLADLDLGAKRDFKLAVLQLRPVRFEHLTMSATRQPDAEKTIAGKPVPVRVFRIQAAALSYDIALDKASWPVETATHTRK